jgi:hypothetical protein
MAFLQFMTAVLAAINAINARAQTTSTRTSSSVRTTGTSTTRVASQTTTLATATVSPTATPVVNGTVRAAAFDGAVDSKILVIVRDAYGAQVASSGLNGYGIPYEILTVPQNGIALPTLNTTAGGNYGGFIIAGQVAYDMGGGNYQSALTPAQWQLMYDYQTQYGVRMVQYDVCKSPAFLPRGCTLCLSSRTRS